MSRVSRNTSDLKTESDGQNLGQLSVKHHDLAQYIAEMTDSLSDMALKNGLLDVSIALKHAQWEALQLIKQDN